MVAKRIQNLKFVAKNIFYNFFTTNFFFYKKNMKKKYFLQKNFLGVPSKNESWEFVPTGGGLTCFLKNTYFNSIGALVMQMSVGQSVCMSVHVRLLFFAITQSILKLGPPDFAL